MKKVFCMITLAAISFGSVYAHGITRSNHQMIQTTDTIKKVKKEKWKKIKKDTTVKKDTAKVKQL